MKEGNAFQNEASNADLESNVLSDSNGSNYGVLIGMGLPWCN